MNKYDLIMTDNYKQLQAMILQSEGKTLEDELGWGCLASNNYQEDENPYKIKRIIWETPSHYDCIEHDGKQSRFPKEALTILGKDIDLARVLRTLAKNVFQFDSELELLGPTIQGLMIKTKNIKTKETDGLIWNLDDPLHLQSPEVLTKLTDLLK